jgi:hypothetical protein
MIFIKSPEDLRNAIKKLETCQDSGKDEIINAIGTYKWYNYYQNTHIKVGSDADKDNEIIFKEIENTNITLHDAIEEIVDVYIDRLNKDVDF